MSLVTHATNELDRLGLKEDDNNAPAQNEEGLL
jgi:hypothetical protein